MLKFPNRLARDFAIGEERFSLRSFPARGVPRVSVCECEVRNGLSFVFGSRVNFFGKVTFLL